MADDKATEDKPKLLGLSGAQTLASAMAAVTAALVGSFLGVAGTLLGAALGSIVATVGAALYAQTLLSAAGVAKERIPVRRRRGVAADTGDGGTEDSTRERLVASAPSKAADPRPARAGKKSTPKAWIKIASVSVGAFAIAMVGITAVEFGTSQPISTLVSSTTATDSGTAERKTTLGSVLTGNQSPSDEADKPTEQVEEVPEQVEEGTNLDGLDTDGTPSGGDSGSAEIVEPGTGETSETAPADPAPDTQQTPAPAPEPDPIPEPEVSSDPGSAEQDGPSGDGGAAGTDQ
ncbi:hypothetical protein ACX8Z9_14530 [Arthrobacter halodurans]|uniref:Uncharacterized protein n=1 Tax=Arthrobacter halodurans TaxID=516699 RepID=A0ABV4ULU5_9MICC